MPKTIIVKTVPPNIALIAAAFPKAIESKSVIFAYGNTIYNPWNLPIREWNIIHEEIHFAQQEEVGGPDKWWDLYINDPKFRAEQELPAYRAEYQCMKKSGMASTTLFYNARHMARALSGAQYGACVLFGHAFKFITK